MSPATEQYQRGPAASYGSRRWQRVALLPSSSPGVAPPQKGSRSLDRDPGRRPSAKARIELEKTSARLPPTSSSGNRHPRRSFRPNCRRPLPLPPLWQGRGCAFNGTHLSGWAGNSASWLTHQVFETCRIYAFGTVIFRLAGRACRAEIPLLPVQFYSSW